MLAFNNGMRFRSEAEDWTNDHKREWIIRRLRLVARRAARDTRYYRELFARVGFDPKADFDYADFARLPVLEREHVQAAGRTILRNAVPSDQLRKDATGGSTGTPTEIWTGPEERGWRESGTEYYMRRIGLPAGSRIALLWGHNLDPVQRHGWRDWMHDWVNNIRWFDCFRLSPAVLKQYHRELQRWQPQCVVAYASALATLAEEVAEHGERPTYPTRCFVTGGEKLMARERAMIEDVFGRSVHERYGSRDVALVGFQSNLARGLDYEVDWSNVLVEPETEERDAPILVTKLHADAMPMLRYRIGDIGRFSEASRPGAPAFTLHDVVGRDTDRIWLPNGQWVHGIEFPHLMKDHPVREFQVVQRADFSVEIRVVPRNHFSDDNREAILQTMKSNLVGVPLKLLTVDEISRTKSNKRRFVITEVSPHTRESTP